MSRLPVQHLPRFILASDEGQAITMGAFRLDNFDGFALEPLIERTVGFERINPNTFGESSLADGEFVY